MVGVIEMRRGRFSSGTVLAIVAVSLAVIFVVLGVYKTWTMPIGKNAVESVQQVWLGGLVAWVGGVSLLQVLRMAASDCDKETQKRVDSLSGVLFTILTLAMFFAILGIVGATGLGARWAPAFFVLAKGATITAFVVAGLIIIVGYPLVFFCEGSGDDDGW